MKKMLFGLQGLLVTISGWSAETNSGPISSVTVAGLVAQNGTPTPNAPVDIVSNNGVVKVSPNLFDEVYPDLTSSMKYKVIYVGNGKFTCSYSMPQRQNKSSMIYFLPGNVSSGASNNSNQVDSTTPRTVKSVNGYVTIAYRTGIDTEIPSDYHCMVEAGETATPYHPYGQIYTDGTVETIADSANHTATVATLLGVGDYRDTQNINTGAITHRVGVKVLDGTEDWTYNNYAFLMNLIGRLPQKHFMFCTHFNYDNGSSTAIPNLSIGGGGTANAIFIKYQTYNTVEQFKQWLADQYAAGTPVIIVYPLETPTTESVAGQTMTTAPVNNRTGGVTGMTVTTLLSSGASVVTTIATNAIKIATTAYNTARFSPVVNDLNDTIATIRDVVTNTINQTKAIADLQAKKQTRPDENCPAGKKCLLVETEENGVIVPHWYEIIENAD